MPLQMNTTASNNNDIVTIMRKQPISQEPAINAKTSLLFQPAAEHPAKIALAELERVKTIRACSSASCIFWGLITVGLTLCCQPEAHKASFEASCCIGIQCLNVSQASELDSLHAALSGIIMANCIEHKDYIALADNTIKVINSFKKGLHIDYQKGCDKAISRINSYKKGYKLVCSISSSEELEALAYQAT